VLVATAILLDTCLTISARHVVCQLYFPATEQCKCFPANQASCLYIVDSRGLTVSHKNVEVGVLIVTVAYLRRRVSDKTQDSRSQNTVRD